MSVFLRCISANLRLSTNRELRTSVIKAIIVLEAKRRGGICPSSATRMKHVGLLLPFDQEKTEIKQ